MKHRLPARQEVAGFPADLAASRSRHTTSPRDAQPQRNSGSPTHFRVTSPEVVARESHCSATTHTPRNRDQAVQEHPPVPVTYTGLRRENNMTIRLNRRAQIASALTMCLAPLSLVSAQQTDQFRTLDRSGLRQSPSRGKAAMKAIQIEASKSRRKSDSQRSLRVARRLHSVLRRQIGLAVRQTKVV
jgi:hypothetical protein